MPVTLQEALSWLFFVDSSLAEEIVGEEPPSLLADHPGGVALRVE